MLTLSRKVNECKPLLTGDARAELAVELKFYGLLDRVIPYNGEVGWCMLTL